eukprot:PhM_4_TR18800/c1_g1_i2/m.91546
MILLLDCCSVHTSTNTKAQFLSECHATGTYSWIRVVFVPANCTGWLQPMDVGVFNIFKPRIMKERTLILLKYFRQQNAQGLSFGCAKRIGSLCAKEQLLDAISAASSLMKRDQTAIQRAWTKCGITVAALTDVQRLATARSRVRDLLQLDSHGV